MSRTLLALLVLTVIPVSAQQEPDPVDVILYGARERMLRQNDAWFKDGDYLPIVRNLEILTDVSSRDEENWSNLSWMYMNIERTDLQWETAIRFSKANPSYADANYYIAEFFYLKRAYAKVPALLEPALTGKTRPDNNVYRFLAHSYNRLGYYQDSLRVWDAYLATGAKDPQGKVNRDRVAEKLKSLKR